MSEYRGSWQPGTAEHPFRRYTIRFEHFPRSSTPTPYEETTLRVSTAGGELKAASMATGLLRSRLGDIHIFTVELVAVDDHDDSDPDVIFDYFEVA